MKSVIESLMMNSQTLDLSLYVPYENGTSCSILHLDLEVTYCLRVMAAASIYTTVNIEWQNV